MIPRSLFAIVSATLTIVGAHAVPALTTIRDVLYKADGARFNGTLTISWNSFQAADNSTIVQQMSTVKVTDGNLRVQLVPSTSATPSILYTVTYNSDGRVQFRETWAVPASAQPLTIGQVRLASPPGGGGNPAPQIGTIEQADVIGLVDELAARPIKGPGYAPNRVAMVNSAGQIESVTGVEGDCVRVDGSSGACGSVAPAFVDHETPEGAVNGSNSAFTLAGTPNPPSSVAIFRNGVLQKAGADYTISGRNIGFMAAAIPQAGDTILASYRVNGSETSPPQFFPSAQVLCSGVGGSTALDTFSNLGVCTIPSGVLSAGDRIELRFDYQHQGAAVGFTIDLQWGAAVVLNRDAPAAETLVTGRADAGLHTAGAQLSVQSWGTVLALATGVATAADAFTEGVTIVFRGKLASAGADSLNLRHFSVVRLP